MYDRKTISSQCFVLSCLFSLSFCQLESLFCPSSFLGQKSQNIMYQVSNCVIVFFFFPIIFCMCVFQVKRGKVMEICLSKELKLQYGMQSVIYNFQSDLSMFTQQCYEAGTRHELYIMCLAFYIGFILYLCFLYTPLNCVVKCE